MDTRYSLIAGQSTERIAALSDGVFAVAMTLLVLELKAPAVEAIHGEGDLWRALVALAPQLLVYMMSFLTLGIFWVGHQVQLSCVSRSDRHLSWLHLAFLFVITLMPFSTALMAEFIAYRTAFLAYWANLVLLGVVCFAAWRYALSAGLMRNETIEQRIGVQRRIVVAQVLYAFGALLCVVSTYWSIAFITLVQLNFAVGPRRGILSRL